MRKMLLHTQELIKKIIHIYINYLDYKHNIILNILIIISRVSRISYKSDNFQYILIIMLIIYNSEKVGRFLTYPTP